MVGENLVEISLRATDIMNDAALVASMNPATPDMYRPVANAMVAAIKAGPYLRLSRFQGGRA
eukprot:5833476-Pyramimonas_sp.AAC.1